MATAPKANKSLKAVPAPDDAAEAPAGSKKTIVIIAAVALLLIVGIGAAAWFYVNNKHSENAAPHIEAPVFMTMDTFTVNLQVEDIPQFLQANITFQIAKESTGDLLRENMPQLRNRMLLLLSSKKASELLSAEGKKQLAAEIIEQVNQPFAPHGPKPEVKDVFFTSFVIQ
jgi:flagellar FliL protein